MGNSVLSFSVFSAQHEQSWRELYLVRYARQKRQILYGITYMWNLKYVTSEYNKKKKKGKEGAIQEQGIKRYKLLVVRLFSH